MTYVMSCDDFVFLFAWARGIKERNNQLNLPVNIFIAFLLKVSQTRLYLLEGRLIALIPDVFNMTTLGRVGIPLS